MSQDDILDVLRELGGRATTLEIRAECRRRWPDRILLMPSKKLADVSDWKQHIAAELIKTLRRRGLV